MSKPSLDDLYVELTMLTRLPRDEWEQILSLPPDLQSLALENYKDQDWTTPGATLTRVLAVLSLIGTIAGTVSGVSGAVSGVSGAITALKKL